MWGKPVKTIGDFAIRAEPRTWNKVRFTLVGPGFFLVRKTGYFDPSSSWNPFAKSVGTVLEDLCSKAREYQSELNDRRREQRKVFKQVERQAEKVCN